jgi:hypothetical protein
MFKVFIFLVIGFLVCTCKGPSKKSDDQPVAKVYEKILYKSQIEGIVPKGLTGTDSTRIVADHIDKWVRQQLLVALAEQNLNESEKDVEDQIEDYRTSLLIFKYEQNYILHKMDTNVNDQQIHEYYNNNSSNFILNNHLSKGLFIQVPRSASNISDVRRWYRSDSPEDIKKLESYCYSNASKYEYFDEHWKYFNEVYQSLPETYERAESILKYRKNYEATDTNFYYFVKISDYRLAGSVAPIEFVKNDIRNILLNKRRIQMIQELEADIYKNALNHDYFNIY